MKAKKFGIFFLIHFYESYIHIYFIISFHFIYFILFIFIRIHLMTDCPARPMRVAPCVLQSSKDAESDLVQCAESALVAFGASYPQVFLEYVESHLNHLTAQRQFSTIQCLGRLMRRDRLQLYPCLNRVIGVILTVLDPHQIAVRDLCMPAVTLALGIAGLRRCQGRAGEGRGGGGRRAGGRAGPGISPPLQPSRPVEEPMKSGEIGPWGVFRVRS